MDISTKNEKARRILVFIIQYKIQHGGISPSVIEIKDSCGISSKSMVAYHLRSLQDEGQISFVPKSARTIEVAGGKWSPPVWFENGQ